MKSFGLTGIRDPKMYLDSAIIVKLLVREEDSSWFDRKIRGLELWSSELAVAEVHSAILMRERMGKVTVTQRKSVFESFSNLRENEILRFHPLNSDIVSYAAELLVRCHPEVGLRSLDAIHLATAILHPRGALCTTDGKLRAAAKLMSKPCFPEEISEITKEID